MITLTYIPNTHSYYRTETEQHLYTDMILNVEDATLAMVLDCAEHTAAFVKEYVVRYPETNLQFLEYKDIPK